MGRQNRPGPAQPGGAMDDDAHALRSSPRQGRNTLVELFLGRCRHVDNWDVHHQESGGIHPIAAQSIFAEGQRQLDARLTKPCQFVRVRGPGAGGQVRPIDPGEAMWRRQDRKTILNEVVNVRAAFAFRSCVARP